MVKSKLRNFLRRSFPVITAMLLIVLCVSPASAANSGAWGVPFDFDSIGLSGNVSTSLLGSVPFPLGSTGPTSVQLGGIGISSGFNDNSDGLINVDWSLSSGSYVMELALYDAVIPSSVIFGDGGFLIFRLYSGTSAVPFSVRVLFNFSYVAERTHYVANSYQDFFTVSSGSGVDLAPLIGEEMTSAGHPSTEFDDYIVFDKIILTFESDVPFERFNMRQPHQISGPTIGAWFNNMQLPVSNVVVDPSNPAGVNFVDWLTVAIGGFLDFELWPGMSLNELLWVCLVIGILFTFFKMIV